jgi:hypothetical protein
VPLLAAFAAIVALLLFTAIIMFAARSAKRSHGLAKVPNSNRLGSAVSFLPPWLHFPLLQFIDFYFDNS